MAEVAQPLAHMLLLLSVQTWMEWQPSALILTMFCISIEEMLFYVSICPFSYLLIQLKFAGELVLILADIRQKFGYTLDRMPALHRTNTSDLFRTKLTSMFLVCWRKNIQAQREQAYSAQKGPQATIRFKEESIVMMRGACYQQRQIFRSWFCRDKNETDIKWFVNKWM